MDVVKGREGNSKTKLKHTAFVYVSQLTSSSVAFWHVNAADKQNAISDEDQVNK